MRKNDSYYINIYVLSFISPILFNNFLFLFATCNIMFYKMCIHNICNTLLHGLMFDSSIYKKFLQGIRTREECILKMQKFYE